MSRKINKKQHFQRVIFRKYEHLLDEEKTGPKWLKHKKIADIVREVIYYRDTTEFDLYAYCIMPNHVHLVFKLLDQNEIEGSNGASIKSDGNSSYPVTTIMQKLKSYTAVQSNKVLGRSGSFWQHESFDRVIRDADELEQTIAYTLNNPVKAELVDYWEEWPYSYCKLEFLSNFQAK